MSRDETDDLSLELHYGRDVIESGVLIYLQSRLAAHAPRMFASLEVHAYEWDRDRLKIDPQRATSLRDAVLARGTDRGPTYDALVAESPPPPLARRFGSVLCRGRGAGTGGRFLHIDFDSDVPARRSGGTWLWSNSITMTVGTATLEGEARSSWMQAFAADLSAHPDFLYGAAYLGREFDTSNLDTSSGLEAIGRDVRRHLPGVYWLNLFGQPYRELMGAQAQRSAAAFKVEEDDRRVIYRAYAQPEDWSGRLADKTRLREGLGDDLFFDRRQPDRRTRAPDLGLRPLPEDGPFQVFTVDGEHFTPVPRFDG